MFEQEIQAMTPELLTRFQDFHQHPELGFAEMRTATIVADLLKSYGLEVHEHIAFTGVVGILDSGKPGKTLMIRADMDCLEVTELSECSYHSCNQGLMHACGHDSHVTMLLGAAKILSQHKETFEGKIQFVFQPAEEGTPKSMYDMVHPTGYLEEGGAQLMVEQGVLDGVDACLVLHVQPSIPTGRVQISKKNACASSDIFTVTITGQGGHGAQPQNAIDPVAAMAQLISAIHLLPAREIGAVETCVISIGKVETPGSVWNAVAETAIISGGYRTFNQNVRTYLGERIETLSSSIATAFRCRSQVVFNKGYMPCINDEALAGVVAKSCSQLLGTDNVNFTDIPAMTSEDCGAYLSRVPGVFLWLGAGTEDGAPPLHSPYFKLDVNAIVVGTNVHVNNAITVLRHLNTQF